MAVDADGDAATLAQTEPFLFNVLRLAKSNNHPVLRYVDTIMGHCIAVRRDDPDGAQVFMTRDYPTMFGQTANENTGRGANNMNAFLKQLSLREFRPGRKKISIDEIEGDDMCEFFRAFTNDNSDVVQGWSFYRHKNPEIRWNDEASLANVRIIRNQHTRKASMIRSPLPKWAIAVLQARATERPAEGELRDAFMRLYNLLQKIPRQAVDDKHAGNHVGIGNGPTAPITIETMRQRQEQTLKDHLEREESLVERASSIAASLQFSDHTLARHTNGFLAPRPAPAAPTTVLPTPNERPHEQPRERPQQPERTGTKRRRVSSSSSESSSSSSTSSLSSSLSSDPSSSADDAPG